MAEEKMTFSWVWHHDMGPMEWLQYIADSFSSLADLWDDYNSDFFEDEFEDYKNESPQSTKKEMYEYIAWERISGDGLIHAYLHDSWDINKEIEHLKPFVLKAFEGCVIFPNLLNAVGIIEDVRKEVEDISDYYYYSLYYVGFLPITPTPEDIEGIIKDLGLNSQQAKRITEKHELTIEDYEEAFEHITELLEKIEKGRYSEKLRESVWAIKGYCKLKAESPEKYAEMEAKIAKRYEQAYQSYQYAEKKTGEDITDKQAYAYLKKHGVEVIEEFDLPAFDTWQRYVRVGRRHYGTQKKTPRTGRTRGQSIIRPNQIQSLSEISSQYPEEDK